MTISYHFQIEKVPLDNYFPVMLGTTKVASENIIFMFHSIKLNTSFLVGTFPELNLKTFFIWSLVT